MADALSWSRGFEQALLVDEARAQARKLAFRQLREALEQQCCDDAVQYAIAEEFQPFVMRGAEAAVSQCLPQQIGIAE